MTDPLALLAEYPDIAALCCAAAVLALRSRRLPALRPLAVSVSVLAALDLALLAPLPRWAAVAAWAAWYVGQWAAVMAGLGAPCEAVAAGAAGWWAVEVARIYVPPALGGDALLAEWATLYAVATACQAVAVAAWAVRAWRRGERPGPAQRAAFLLAAGALADWAGPWAAGAVGAAGRWEVGRWQSAATWMGVVGVVGWQGRSKAKRPDPR